MCQLTTSVKIIYEFTWTTHYCDHVVKEFPEFIDRFEAEKTRLCARANVGAHYSDNFQKYKIQEWFQ